MSFTMLGVRTYPTASYEHLPVVYSFVGVECFKYFLTMLYSAQRRMQRQGMQREDDTSQEQLTERAVELSYMFFPLPVLTFYIT